MLLRANGLSTDVSKDVNRKFLAFFTMGGLEFSVGRYFGLLLSPSSFWKD